MAASRASRSDRGRLPLAVLHRLKRGGDPVHSLQHDGAIGAEPAPEDLTDKVADLLEEEPELSWDQAVRQIVEAAIEDEDDGDEEGET